MIVTAKGKHSKAKTRTPAEALGDFSFESDRLVNTREASRLSGFTVKTHREWRSKRMGPAFIKFGKGPRGRVLYRLSALTAWVRENAQGCQTSPTVVQS
jgi:hypothetical protein